MASLGASERVDVPWVTLMGSPSITARLPGVVAQRVHAAAGTCITDEHKARGRQRAGATQRGATTSVCASLCQSFVAEVSRGGVLKTQTIFGPQLFKAVNKVFKSTSWFPWYKSFSLTCKAQIKFHPSIPNFYLKRHLGYCSIVSNERFLFKIVLLRHAQLRKPKNEALIYSLLLYSEGSYSRGFTLRHATIRL